VRQGFLGPLDVAVIEVTGVREDGSLIPSSSVGNSKVWIDNPEKVILEVNLWQSEQLEEALSWHVRYQRSGTLRA
jgi:succinyl-CoA:acetate CoA-transferase